MISGITADYIRELALLDSGWKYYDRRFSTILDRRQYHFTFIGKTCYAKKREESNETR